MKFKSKLLRIGIAGFLFLSIIGVNLFHVDIVHALAADAYWYGDSGNWTDYTNHWSNNSGDSPHSNYGGVPTAATNVYFDALSFTGNGKTVLCDAASCISNNMDWTGTAYTVTFTTDYTDNYYIYGNFTGCNKLTISGNDNNQSNATFSFVGTSGTQLWTNNGTVWVGGGNGQSLYVSINGTGGCVVSLQDALTMQPSGSYYAGLYVNSAFSTNNNTISNNSSLGQGMKITGGAVANLGSSSITTPRWSLSGTNNFNTGTSNINVTGTLFAGGGATYNNVVLTGAGVVAITGANTFANLTRTGTAAILDGISFSANQTITGTLTLQGNAVNQRLLVQSAVVGSPITLTAATVSVSNADFEDIAGAGAGNWNLSAIIGLSGDCGGNSGITLTTGHNEYWYENDGTWTDASRWGSTSGNGGTGRVPLPQDTAIFDNNSITATGRVITLVANYRTGGINISSIPYDPTFLCSGSVITYGSLVGGTVTWTAGDILFCGRGLNTLSGASVILPPIQVGSPNGDGIGGTVTLQDSITVNGAITLYAGILDFNNKNPTFASFDSSVNYNARTLNLGNGTITVNSTASITKWNVDSTNFTLIRGTSTIVMTSAGTNAQSMTGGGLVYNNLTIGGLGVYTFNFYDSNTYSTLEIDRSQSAKTIGGSVTETVSQLSIPVVSTTVVTINGIRFAQALGIFATEYVNVTSSTVTGISYYAGATPPSVDGGGNTGWIFSEPPLPVVTTQGASQVQFYSAIFNGALDTLAGQPNGYVCFEYGTTSSYGSETPQQFVTTAGTFYQAMTGMTAGTTYHFTARFYYNSGAAHVDGADQVFSTFGSSGIPSITTLDATNLSVTTMTLQGRIDNLGGIATVYAYIEWGLDKNYLGGTTPQLSYTSPSSILQGQITELSRSTTYHFQAVLKYYDSAGVLQTVLGGDKTAKTLFVSDASEVITVISANAFRGYEEDGDYLFTAEVMDTYRTDTEKLYPTANIGKYFFLQLLDPTDTTILAQTPLAFWGDRPISIYLNAVAGAGLTEGAYYHLKVVGNFVGAPTASSQDYTLTDDDWGGTSLILLDDWCISAAQNMEISDNVAPGSYVVSSTDNKQVITNAAGGYFTTGIPQISAIRPNLFQQSESQATATLGAKNDQWSSKHVWATQVGAQIASDWNTIGSLFYGDSAHGASAMGFILLIIAILICIFGVMLGGKGLPLLILSFPLLYWGTEMGALAYQWLLVPCVAMVMLWARQFWVKPT